MNPLNKKQRLRKSLLDLNTQKDNLEEDPQENQIDTNYHHLSMNNKIGYISKNKKLEE